jgi:hypothetical protein
MITNFRKAWVEFKKTDAYKSTSISLKNYGVKQPYRDNILRVAFDAGWGNRFIKEVDLGSKPKSNPNPNEDNDD